MPHKQLLIALGMIGGAPVSASIQDPAPAMAPAASPDALYCMRIEPIVGSRLEEVKCWTREQWAQNEVDVDQDWAKEGVAIIEDGLRRPARG